MEFDMYHGYNFVQHIVRNHTEIKRIYVGYRKVWEGRISITVYATSKLIPYATVELEKASINDLAVQHISRIEDAVALSSELGSRLDVKSGIVISETVELSSALLSIFKVNYEEVISDNINLTCSSINDLVASLFVGFPEVSIKSGESAKVGTGQDLNVIEDSIVSGTSNTQLIATARQEIAYVIPLKITLFAVCIIHLSLIELFQYYSELDKVPAHSLVPSDPKLLESEVAIGRSYGVLLEHVFSVLENARRELSVSEGIALSKEVAIIENSAAANTSNSSLINVSDLFVDNFASMLTSPSALFKAFSDKSWIDEVNVGNSFAHSLFYIEEVIEQAGLVVSNSNLATNVLSLLDLEEILDLKAGDVHKVSVKYVLPMRNYGSLVSNSNNDVKVSHEFELEEKILAQTNQNERISTLYSVPISEELNVTSNSNDEIKAKHIVAISKDVAPMAADNNDVKVSKDIFIGGSGFLDESDPNYSQFEHNETIFKVSAKLGLSEYWVVQEGHNLFIYRAWDANGVNSLTIE